MKTKNEQVVRNHYITDKYLSDDYTVEDLKNLLDEHQEAAEERGFTNVLFSFAAVSDYDDYYDVRMTLTGDRPATEAELKDLKKQKKEEAEAKQLGITSFEYEVLKRLKAKGIKLD